MIIMLNGKKIRHPSLLSTCTYTSYFVYNICNAPCTENKYKMNKYFLVP